MKKKYTKKITKLIYSLIINTLLEVIYKIKYFFLWHFWNLTKKFYKILNNLIKKGVGLLSLTSSTCSLIALTPTKLKSEILL